MAVPRAWQKMLSGRRLDLLDPTPVDVEIEEIVVVQMGHACHGLGDDCTKRAGRVLQRSGYGSLGVFGPHRDHLPDQQIFLNLRLQKSENRTGSQSIAEVSFAI